MRKRLLAMFLGCALVAVSACGSTGNSTADSAGSVSAGQETEITEETEMGENNNELSEEELKKFATGTSEEESGTSEETKVQSSGLVADGTISETCPSAATTRKMGVKYGSFVHKTYYSETCGMERGYTILLPASYETDTDRNYPVLYLLHGIFGNEYSMTDSGNKVVEMTANLAADGLIDEVIVVCPNMFAADNTEIQPGFTAEQCLPYDNFINDLVNDLMPEIEKTYRAATGRENTMLAGFSMGGRETLYIAVQRPELFGYVCAISAAPGVTPGKDGFMSHPGQLSEQEFKFADDAVLPDVFMLCCGTKDSVVGTFPKSYHEILETNGVNHIWYEIEGADHDTNAIKSGLYNLFMQMAYSKLNN